MPTSRVVVVSNRVPAASAAREPWSAGGLVSALVPALELSGARWFGWSGKIGDASAPPHRWRERGVSYATLDLSDEQVHGHYEEFCNRALWPLLHGLPARASESAGDFIREYRDVNQRFAAALYPLLRAGDLVWVHDYHLIPMAAELRRLGWRGRVGYFHHIPVPEPETWSLIPYHQDLAQDLEDYDLIGVQTRGHAKRLRALLSGRAARRVEAYPISIDAQHFRAGLANVEAPPIADDQRMVFFGVDRLDYTKAIPERLRAFGRAVARNEAIRDGSRFVQWAAPSRTSIPEYQEERRAIEDVVQTIDPGGRGDFISVEFDSKPPALVAAALQRADVCVVTSVADGMNLVAKEFAAVHSAEHPGVLVLSDSCGAAEELTDALIYRAGDEEGLARAIEAAFEMPDEERRRRSAALREVVDSWSSGDWFDRFVDDLADASGPSEEFGLTFVPAHVERTPLRDRVEQRLREFESDRTIERIWARDYQLWKPDPAGVADRLGWLDVDRFMVEQVDQLRGFAAEVRQAGYTHAVLLGMGGSTLGARVLASAFAGHTRGLGLTVLDSTVPAAIRPVEERAAATKTLFIVSSKSGTTAETMALLDYFWDRHPRGRDFVAITDPGTPLERTGQERNFRAVYLNPPDIGGRYSALSFSGLVPGALMGIDVRAVLDAAAAMRHECGPDVAARANPGARLGAALAEAALSGREFLSVDGRAYGGAYPGAFGRWLEQLVAESTGKEGRGILPVLSGDGPDLGDGYPSRDPEHHPSAIGLAELEALAATSRGATPRYSDPAAIGGEYLRWEFAVAVAGSVLGINPFDQPDVDSTKRATERLLQGHRSAAEPRPLRDLVDAVDGRGYVALHGYVPPSRANARRLDAVRCRLSARLGVPVTVEYGPSLLHSTGQYHKGGGQRGSFVQIVEPSEHDLAIPGREYDFDELKDAQAAGDLAALEQRGRAVARASLGELEAL